MKFAMIFGFIMTCIGLVLSFPPVVKELTVDLGQVGNLGGLIVFALGWASLAGYLAFNLGFDKEKGK